MVSLTVHLPPTITGLTKLKEGLAPDLSATAEVTGDEEEPTIYTWNEDGVLLQGDNVELTVTLTGTEPISYQWYHGEELVEGGTESTLRLTDVQGVDSGEYYVKVSNQLGTELSEVITLSVVPWQFVTELAGSINVVEGEGVELTVTAVGSAPLTYQWSKGEEMIGGATAPTLDLGNVKVSSEADYKLAISNAEGLVGSVVITVVLVDPPVIVTQPVGGSANLDEAFTFEVVAEGTGLEYEWYHDGALVEAATGSTLPLTDLEVGDAGNYYVVISNAANEVTSEMVSLTVHLPPTITGLTKLKEGPAVDLSATAEVTGDEEEPTTYQWSQGGALLEGDNVELTVTATGTEPISYQWHHGEESVATPAYHWKLETDVEDSGPHNNHGTLQGETQFADGALQLEGAGSVEISDIALSEFPAGFTMSFDVQFDAIEFDKTDVYQQFVWAAVGDGMVPDVGSSRWDNTLSLTLYHDVMAFDIRVDNKWWEPGTGNLVSRHITSKSQWEKCKTELCEITATVDADGYMFLYLNGTLIPPTTTAFQPIDFAKFENLSYDKLSIGRQITGATPFHGVIKDFRLYNGLASSASKGTESTLRLTDVQGEDSGDYHVMVSNQLGTEFSEVITLSVVPPPVVTEVSGTISVLEGNSVELSVAAVADANDASFGCQWSRNGELIDGATASTLDLGAGGESVTDEYKVEVTKDGELVGLAVITVTTVEPVTIVKQPGGSAADGVTVYYETFEDVKLGPNVDERLSSEQAWTRTGPKGWLVDRSGVPGNSEDHVGYIADEDEDGYPDNDGVSEWAGWSFADYAWWVKAAGDQSRSQFTLAKNVVAVADPDEWDDKAHAGGAANGWYKTLLTTPKIDVSGIVAGTLSARFHSSWRPEFDGNYHQEGYILASYDGAEPVEILTWVSDRSSSNYHGNNQNEVVTLPLNNPDGATKLQLTFGMREAGNDWWWAIDNLVVFGGASASASADLGGSISFEVVAEGTEPISYEWYHDGTAIEEGTGSILALTDLEVGMRGITTSLYPMLPMR